MSVCSWARQFTWIWCNLNKHYSCGQANGIFQEEKAVKVWEHVASRDVAAGKTLQHPRGSAVGRGLSSPPVLPLGCDTSAVLRHNFFIALTEKGDALCIEWVVVFLPGGYFGGAICSSSMMTQFWDGAQGPLRPGWGADSQAWHEPYLGSSFIADGASQHGPRALLRGTGLSYSTLKPWNILGCF